MLEIQTKWQKIGCVITPKQESYWWNSHVMAPAAVFLEDKIRVYFGGWSIDGISRIGYIDVDKNDPSKILKKSNHPVLNIGKPGCFDENGVFPGHVYAYDGKIYLYYTGFQLGHKVRHYNFGGLAVSEDGGETFTRVSEAPVMDRSDEGLFVRAGNSCIVEDDVFKGVYSAGSDWLMVKGEKRPVYDVFYQETSDGITFERKGKRIVSCDLAVEHGLGRPQIFKKDGAYYVFYTRRMLDMQYHMGCAVSRDLKTWDKIDDWLSTVKFGNDGEFDNEMVYFPCVVDTGEKTHLFYSGNYFGKGGLGVATLECK